MSADTLQRFLERLSEDASFRESVRTNPESAFAQFGLSPAEQTALSSGDEDALRRLAGADVVGFRIYEPSIMCPPIPMPAPQTRLVICAATVGNPACENQG